MTEHHQADHEAEMIELGRGLAEGLRSGEVLALVGGLGAGKTHFCKGLALGLGSADPVTSPTFGLVHEYRGGRLPLFHFDWYRLESAAELESLGWDDYLDDEGIIAVEWADRFEEMLPETTLWIRIEPGPGGSRRISVTRP